MPVEISLKRKYRTGGKSRYKGSYGGNNHPARQKHKLTEREIELHRRQPKKIMILSANGKTRMVLA